MELQVAATSLRLSQPSAPHSPSSSKAFASCNYLSSPQNRSLFGGDRDLLCRYSDTSSLLVFECKSSKLRSFEKGKFNVRRVRKTLYASLDRFSDDEFEKRVDEFERMFDDDGSSTVQNMYFRDHLKRFNASETPEFRDERNVSCFNSQKKVLQEGFIQAGETAYCSIKKAFSSMVFIIRELHSFTLQMREILFYEDLQGILGSVHREIHASFVWLFQKVFSHTPTLMVSVMILLANYSVYSMSTTAAIAAMPPVQAYNEEVYSFEDPNMMQKIDSSTLKMFTLPSSNGKTSSIGENGGGGGRIRPVASSTEGDDKFDKSNKGEEDNLLRSVLDKASKMHEESRDEIESDDYPEYFRTELQYQMSLSEEPMNPLVLANFAQFLYLVAQDYDRAEYYFKRATNIEPKDADALNKYAKFLWLVRNDIMGAEDTFLESIAAENKNSFYAADYAHFLWNTGGKDTCFPLNSGESC